MIDQHAQSTQRSTANPMANCIDTCIECHRTCSQMAMTHCLNLGGKHIEPKHFRLMLSCAELCQTAANTMLMQSEQHAKVCAVCSEICKACAQSCKNIGDMDECVTICERCASECEAMSAY